MKVIILQTRKHLEELKKENLMLLNIVMKKVI